MILVCGIPTEGPVERVLDELLAQGAPAVVLNQRRVVDWDLGFEFTDDGLVGWLKSDGSVRALADVTGAYVRLMDHRRLPEYLTGDAGFRALCDARHHRLLEWLEVAPARVLNRAGPMASNFSKPYQAQLIMGSGFDTPPTLVTSDPRAVREFLSRHGRIIYKSASCVRSIVREFKDEDLARLESVRWCPTQFQAFIPGVNIRVHVVGESVFPTEIVCDSADYRYAGRDGESAVLRPMVLSEEISARCRGLSQRLGLPLAGIDLKRTAADQWYCFEVNPSPGFSYYESQTQQPIAAALARYLAEAGT